MSGVKPEELGRVGVWRGCVEWARRAGADSGLLGRRTADVVPPISPAEEGTGLTGVPHHRRPWRSGRQGPAC